MSPTIRIYVLSLLFISFFLAMACGEVESILEMSSNQDSLPADGKAEAALTIRASFRGEPVSDGTRINLTASAGSFTDRNQRETRVTTTAGQAQINWAAPYSDDTGKMFLGEVILKASYTDPYKENQEAEIIISMIVPPPIDGSSFRFWCSAQNVMAPTGADPLRLPCSVQAKDINGQDVNIDMVRFGFLTETGQMEIGKNGLEWVLFPGDRPKQVSPLGSESDGEPRWIDQAAGNLIRNPRDGIATLVVHARGAPTGPADLLQGEPFVDENDDGERNEGEAFFDSNDNGAYDGPQAGNDPRRLWRWTKMMITGPVSERAMEATIDVNLWDTGSASHQNIEIEAGASRTIKLNLLDENLNPLSSHPIRKEDTIKLTIEPREILTPLEQALKENTIGLTFDNITGQIVAGSSRTGYLQGDISYSFRVENNLQPGDSGQSWSIKSAEIQRTPYPGSTTTITRNLDASNLPAGYLKPSP